MSLTKVADSQLPDFVFDPSGFSGSGTSADPFLNLATTNGTSIKSSVRAASTGNLTLSGTQTVDGIALVAGDRVLVKNQTTTANNGVYVVATGAWVRATDADSSAKITGAVVPVMLGTVNSNSIWINTTINVTLGTTTVTFATVLKAGTNLTLTGNSLAVNAAPTFTTQASGTNNTTAATTAFVQSAVTAPVVDIVNTSVVNLVSGTKYYANHAALSTGLLPTTAAKGSQILMRGQGTGGWRISQNANQKIHGASDSTTGTGGYLASQTQYDTVVLECMVANLEWIIVANRGTLTIA